VYQSHFGAFVQNSSLSAMMAQRPKHKILENLFTGKTFSIEK